MNRIVVGVFAVCFMCASHAFGASRQALWKEVDEAVRKGLPRSAITNLEPIISGALKDKDYPEAVKAIGRKISLEGTIEGGKAEERITRLEQELTKAPAEMAPLLETLLAHWYWHYYQNNRWRFLQRTATAAQPGRDFTTWDLPRLFEEISRHFEKALSADAQLKRVPIAAWDTLIEKGTMPDAYRPTLYDFIAHEALKFYTAPEQGLTKAEGAFEVTAESPALDTVEKFLAWRVNSETNPISLPAKAIGLFQALLRFHSSDPEPRLAYAHNDLERLNWAWNVASGEEKEARYKQALRRFIQQYADFEISALASERLAQALRRDNDLVAAREEALRAVRAFRDSAGGKLCQNLASDIEAKSSSINTERVWNAPAPEITVTYRNVDKVFFRAIAYSWENFLDRRRNRPENLTVNERREILAKSPALEWSTNLPPTTDYREKKLALPAPLNLKPGFYFIAASHDPKFGEAENVVSMTDVWVSELSLITRVRAERIEGFVLEALSGEPIGNAEVLAWYLNQNGQRVPHPTVRTDENGFFSLKPTLGRGHMLLARHNGREIASAWDVAAQEDNSEQRERARAQTILFTDRAIYRPGQTIQYKGICLWVDLSRDKYEVLKGEEVTVVYTDVNGEEIAKQKKTANDYGSFSGSFTAPRDRLMGQMGLRIEGRAQGNASVTVEEYKRPKFEVKLEAPKTAAKLNDRVAVRGVATSYTGAAVDGADVRYRVVRQVRWPWWWGWRGGWMPPSESQEIAHGTARTETDGAFTIEFVAKPDPKVLEKDEPTFSFEITADVTDSAGETRSDERTIRAGYTALEAKINAADWQTPAKPVELTISTLSLDGEPQVAEGVVKIHALLAPEKVQRGALSGPYQPYRRGSSAAEPDDLSDPKNWPLGPVVSEKGFSTGTNGEVKLSFALKEGAYQAVLETQDRFGKKVTGRLPIQVLDPAASKLSIKIPQLVAAQKWEAQPGDEFEALWGTGYDSGRAFIELEHRGGLLKRYWTKPGRTQEQIRIAVTEAMRGGVTLHITQVRENRAYLKTQRIEVPWNNKELTLKWEHFVSKLEPGQKETWSLSISGVGTNASAAEKATAEVVATLYDESLDAFAPQHWPDGFGVFRQDVSSWQPTFANLEKPFQRVFGAWSRQRQRVEITYRSLPTDLVGQPMFTRFARRGAILQDGIALSAGVPAAAPTMAMKAAPMEADANFAAAEMAVAGAAPLPGSGGGAAPPKPAGPVQVTPRKNLNETAFFFPHLTSDSNGVVRMTFSMPEALTRWRFLGFAHDRALRGGLLEDHAVTSKDLMVQPNPPRFLREGDTVEFTVKITNQSDKPQDGKVLLNFSQISDEKSADALLGNKKPEQAFSIPPKQSRTASWRITVPDGCGFLIYKAVASSDRVSDGEEGAVPVLSRRILVTESLPLPIRGPGTKKFEFTKLLNSEKSSTLRHQSLTAQMVSNPAWYAVLALPYLMEYPHECSEQVFNRFYANALARSIANSDPNIRRIFDQWKNTPALDSPLEKNQDLKSVMLEETPWLREAKDESQARRNVGILFDENRLNSEQQATLQKLAQMQLDNGGWPWFPGGNANDYITLYITTGFGRLRHLGADIDASAAIRSLSRLDDWMRERYQDIQKHDDPEKHVLSPTEAMYLYGRSFFLKDKAIDAEHKTALDFFLAQGRKFWLETGNRQTQAHLALALQRFGAEFRVTDRTPADIMNSLRERSVSNEEMGMFWRDTELSWWWYRAPIETQALMIEAFDEVAKDAKAVEDCRVWLLKQKQTQDWKTTKATADAVYALLLRGRDILSSRALVELKLGGEDVTPSSSPKQQKKQGTAGPVEAGTGFYEVRFQPSEIKPRLGRIEVTKPDAGVAWGSVHWQYLEDMAKVTPYTNTPLKLQKSLYIKRNTSSGPVIEAVKGPLQVGDELVVRIELRTDRDMEYVHMKDQRGSGTEPVNVLSNYKYQDGLAYYESTRDTATHFFIDYLPKGTYVFEYSSRVQLKGKYLAGVTLIECMYAPEFNSHSAAAEITVR